ncbi:uncharacterized protein isoform X2 [Rhodnius prolixus]|uniref:uncharacterized protein isoform X2 n=1 Tax=Rhodnius prolixus TaxID=13249 RepID=UPI003D18E6E0
MRILDEINTTPRTDLSPEVESALQEKKAVVALETTIVTHGMPHPQNYETALTVERIIRDQDCIPAHIAIYDGRIKVGLSDEQLRILSDPSSKAIKTSRRDFPFVISERLHGGTTVSGTLLIAGRVGINIFVTGGVGGVHRNGEDTLDISADLRELGRHQIMVVSSGVKSILDIGLTLEYLETEGVCVVTYGPNRHFPAFYCNKSGFMAPYQVQNPRGAAVLLKSVHELNMKSGILLAVPVPSEYSIDSTSISSTINLALKEAKEAGIKGKDVTPFVLDKVNHLTGGKSLKTNIALIKNNAFVGAQVAKEFEKLNRTQKLPTSTSYPILRKPVVIGGSILDCVVSIDSDLKLDGRTLPGKIGQSPGGVGRNVADALGKLYRTPPLLLSAVASDQFGACLLDSLNHIDSTGVMVNDKERTASYTVLVDKFGEAKLAVGDMCIHSVITPSQISKHKDALINAPMIVMDGNLSEESMLYTLNVAAEHRTPIWFEPTELKKAAKPFSSELWKSITCTSPNLNELITIAKTVGVSGDISGNIDDTDINTLIKLLAHLTIPLAEYIPVIMITLGRNGILMISRVKHDEAIKDNFQSQSKEIFVRYYPAAPQEKLINAVGAGDCAAAGFISGILQGFTEPECVSLGIRAAKQALKSNTAIPQKFDFNFSSRLNAEFTNILI